MWSGCAAGWSTGAIPRWPSTILQYPGTTVPDVSSTPPTNMMSMVSRLPHFLPTAAGARGGLELRSSAAVQHVLRAQLQCAHAACQLLCASCFFSCPLH